MSVMNADANALAVVAGHLESQESSPEKREGVPCGERLDDAARGAVAVPLLRERRFAAHLARIADSRRFVTDTLSDWRLAVPLDDVRLCVGELAANAVQHAGPAAGEFRVRVVLDGSRLRVEVYDDGEGVPAPKRATAEDCDGRGLLLVSRLADNWGVASRSGPDRAVWAEFMAPTNLPR